MGTNVRAGKGERDVCHGVGLEPGNPGEKPRSTIRDNPWKHLSVDKNVGEDEIKGREQGNI